MMNVLIFYKDYQLNKKSGMIFSNFIKKKEKIFLMKIFQN